MKKPDWRRKQQLTGYLFILPNMAGIAFFFVIPVIFSLLLVFTNWQFMNPHIQFIGFGNVKRMLHDSLFYASLIQTVLFLCAVPVSIALAFILAVVLNRYVWFKGMLRSMFFIPYITNGVAVAYVWMVLFEPSKGPINAFLSGIGIAHPPGWLADTSTAMVAIDIVWVWIMLGYNMIIYLAALQEISPELLEAAKVDGAKWFDLIRRIMLPAVSPTTFLLLITGLIMTIKTFGIIQATTQGGPGSSTTVLSLLVYKNAFRYYEMGYASTVSWALFLIIMVITMIQWFGQKKWVHY